MSNLRYIYALGILPFHLSYALAILIDNFWSMALTPENSTTLRVEFSILEYFSLFTKEHKDLNLTLCINVSTAYTRLTVS